MPLPRPHRSHTVLLGSGPQVIFDAHEGRRHAVGVSRVNEDDPTWIDGLSDHDLFYFPYRNAVEKRYARHEIRARFAADSTYSLGRNVWRRSVYEERLREAIRRFAPLQGVDATTTYMNPKAARAFRFLLDEFPRFDENNILWDPALIADVHPRLFPPPPQPGVDDSGSIADPDCACNHPVTPLAFRELVQTMPKSHGRRSPISLLEAFWTLSREEFTQGVELSRLLGRDDDVFTLRRVLAAESLSHRGRRRVELSNADAKELLAEYQFGTISFDPHELANRARYGDLYARQLQDCAVFANCLAADARNHVFQLVTKGLDLFQDRLPSTLVDLYQREPSQLSDHALKTLAEKILPRLLFHENDERFIDICRRYFAQPLTSQASCHCFHWHEPHEITLLDGDGRERKYLRRPVTRATLAPAPADGPASRRRPRAPKGRVYTPDASAALDVPPPPPHRSTPRDASRLDADGDIVLLDVDDSRSVASVNSSTASLRAGVMNLGLNSRPAIDPELAPNLLELDQLPSLGYVEKRPKNPP
ncbi:hypothetical protein HDU96_002134, partial [Phlyctochytrium bullatum]